MRKAAARPPARGDSPLWTPAFRRFLTAGLIPAAGSATAPVALAHTVIGQGGGAAEPAAVALNPCVRDACRVNRRPA